MAGTISPTTRWHTLFAPGDFSPVSPIFSFEKQVTIKAIGLVEGDEITFNILKIKEGSFASWCNCVVTPGKAPTIEGSQQLMCGECMADGVPRPVRLTKDNPVIVLDAPQNTFIMAVYEGDGVGTAHVSAAFNTTTDSSKLDSAMRGCPTCEPPPEPEPQYYATVEIPGGGLAYRDGMQDPAATVALNDCDGNLVGWIYPEPNVDAQIEVKRCDTGDLLGYAVGYPGYSEKTGGNTTIIQNDKITIAGIPGLTINSIPAIRIERVPRLAVGSFEKNGDVFILYNDGTYEMANIPNVNVEPVKMITITFANSTVPAMEVQSGEPFVLPDASDAGFLEWELNYESYSAGTTVTRKFNTTFTAVYE